ncbi:MAG: hypothetical protein KF857_07250 [Fimbriimonadaceae bacterium]|nr:hypothetical protein [Fimbriimonadaceae bacterium]
MTARVWLEDHAVVRLTGGDRTAWLQGQVTQDLSKMEAGDALEACFVKPTGQIQAYAEVFATPDAVLLVTDRPAIVEERVGQFVILEDVRAEVVQVGVWKALGLGLRLPGGPEVLALPEGSLGDYHLATLRDATPLAGVDYDDKTLLPELGPSFVGRTVSYNKGCYTGQEVLMRVHSRGHTNRTWVVLRVGGEVAAGDIVTHGGERVGKVTRASESGADGWLAATMLPNRLLQSGTQVQIGEVSSTVP